jgi:peptidoglycan-associated lipoprotein
VYTEWKLGNPWNCQYFVELFEEDCMSTKNAVYRRFAMIIGVAALIAVTGCSSAKKKTDTEEAVPTAPSAEETAASGDSDHGGAMGLQTVHFAYDSYRLDTASKDTMKTNAQVLKDHPNLKVQIEGHTDQRGGIQYNIALGEKRANAAKSYLEGLGISGDRITTISYGKERPVDPGTTEEAYAKNRRGNFIITSR